MNRPIGGRGRGPRKILCDDAVTVSLQYSTQRGALCHLGYRFDADGDGEAEWVYYNGWCANRDVFDHDQGGARRPGIETMARKALQTRGVLLELELHLGKERRRSATRICRRFSRFPGSKSDGVTYSACTPVTVAPSLTWQPAPTRTPGPYGLRTRRRRPRVAAMENRQRYRCDRGR